LDFKVKEKDKLNVENYNKNDIDVAYSFTKKIYKEMGKFFKAIVLFGSTARKKTKSNDIDILLVIDDISIELSKEFVQTYRIIVEKTLAETSTKIHVTTLKFTNFWEFVRAGDPVAVNILRDGIALIDTGFFEPLQALLHQGRIRPSQESVWSYFQRAPQTIMNSKWHLSQAVIDLYWAVIDSAHAALMKLNQVPPSPEHVAELMEEKLVKTGFIDKKYPNMMNNFYNLSKMILSREIKEITGSQYEDYLKEAEEFVQVMREFIEKK
jgi:uncharacterized protein (UPF0332 family)/predicted nucleotidyltransferase